ncbi:MAG: hypothetical protein GY820_17325 [Gammaproteobacteria bacterium]|nr:hypothetical protein [Gammaproteobacteria bacterium]
MITKWKATVALNRIYKQECKSETKKFVVVSNGMRWAKESRGVAFCDTWEEAHAFLMGYHENKLQSARYQLQQAQGAYGNVKGMKKPKEG